MTLREKLLRGGLYLVARQGLGVIISLGGVILLTRLIGPVNYGLYAGAFGIVTTLAVIGRFGADVFLIRREQPPQAALYHQAFTLLLLNGLGIITVALLAIPLLTRWFNDPRFVSAFIVLVPSVLLSVLAVPAIAQLERDLRYRAVGLTELSGLLAYYVVALTLALFGAGFWAPIAGYWVSRSLQLVVCCILARFRPRLCWSPAILKEMLGYGLSYSASSWIWQLRSLVNPVMIGRYAGPEAVAYIALAIRLVQVISVVKQVTWRLSIAALGKLQGEFDRLRRALEEAMFIQTLAIGLPLAGFALIAPWLIPAAFGTEWSPVLKIFSYIAVGQMVNAIFNMHSSVLYVLKRNRSVAWFNTVHMLLFACSCLILVPKFGILGYGLAELVALTSYVVPYITVARLFPVSYAASLPWIVVLIPPLFAVDMPMPWGFMLGMPAIALALMPNQRKMITRYWRYVPRWKAA